MQTSSRLGPLQPVQTLPHLIGASSCHALVVSLSSRVLSVRSPVGLGIVLNPSPEGVGKGVDVASNAFS